MKYLFNKRHSRSEGQFIKILECFPLNEKDLAFGQKKTVKMILTEFSLLCHDMTVNINNRYHWCPDNCKFKVCDCK